MQHERMPLSAVRLGVGHSGWIAPGDPEAVSMAERKQELLGQESGVAWGATGRRPLGWTGHDEFPRDVCTVMVEERRLRLVLRASRRGASQRPRRQVGVVELQAPVSAGCRAEGSGAAGERGPWHGLDMNTRRMCRKRGSLSYGFARTLCALRVLAVA